jgi:hypothetical protein
VVTANRRVFLKTGLIAAGAGPLLGVRSSTFAEDVRIDAEILIAKIVKHCY